MSVRCARMSEGLGGALVVLLAYHAKSSIWIRFGLRPMQHRRMMEGLRQQSWGSLSVDHPSGHVLVRVSSACCRLVSESFGNAVLRNPTWSWSFQDFRRSFLPLLLVNISGTISKDLESHTPPHRQLRSYPSFSHTLAPGYRSLSTMGENSFSASAKEIPCA